MANVILVKNFKYKDLQRTVFLISYYHSVLLTKLVNYLQSKLLFELSNTTYLYSNSRNVNLLTLKKKSFWGDLVQNITFLPQILNNSSARLSLCVINIFLTYKLNQHLINLQKKHGVVSLKTRNVIYTVLRSPHTDKKSREQFKKVEYRKLVTSIFNSTFLDLLKKKECITSKIRSTYVR